MISYLTSNCWQQNTPSDPELGIPPSERCCVPEYICRDWTQLLSVLAVPAILGGVGYGYFARNYVVASIVVVLAGSILILCTRVWCLVPGARLGRNVIAIANERKKTKQELDEAKANLAKLQTAATDLETSLKQEKELLAEHKAQNQTAIDNFEAQNQKLAESVARYDALKKTYDDLFKAVKETESQIAQLKEIAKIEKSANDTLKKEKESLASSTADLHHGVDRMDEENKEFDGENDEQRDLLKTLANQVSSLKSYVATLNSVLAEQKESLEAAKLALKQAQEVNELQHDASDLDKRLAALESAGNP
jgi:chromosome segregation ATPase